jgi:phosphoglycolate phosphatase-like HAD superfamily hydrolase
MIALWDIDGTLLRVDHGIGREMYKKSFRTLFDVDVSDIVKDMSFAGRTDRGLVYEIIDAASIPRTELDAVWTAFAADMTGHAKELITPSTVTVLDGAIDALHALQEQGIVNGLLTGNIDGIAQHKLEMAGIPLLFVGGALGDDHEDRRDLPPRAIDAVNRASGGSFATTDAVIIGDAIGDVVCARAHGIACIAVTTGVHTAQELHEAGATMVVDTLAPGASTASRLRQVLGYL